MNQTFDGRRTKAFTTIFMIELWERFGYYGMAALLVLYMVQQMGFSDARANLTWGAFAAMVYAVPTIGGWLGDKILGARRTMLLGAAVLLTGYSLLALPAANTVFIALGVIAVGNGLFKANPGNLISRLYEGDPARVDSAFTMYYMAVNLGAFVSQSSTPWIAAHYGWHTAFAVCAGGLIAGLLNYLLMRRHLGNLGSEPDHRPLRYRNLGLVLLGTAVVAAAVTAVIQNLAVARAVVWTAGVVLLGIFGYMIARGRSSERAGLIAVLLLTAQTILFFIYYQQMSTSLTLFALRNVNLDWLGLHIEPGSFQTFNPFWIMVLSPVLAWYYTHRSKGKGDFSIATKFAMGFVLVCAGFFTYGFSGHFAVAGKVSAWWMVWGYGLLSLGELLISGLGLAMVARFVPPRLRGFMMGAWFLATGISQYLGSMVANIASVPREVTDPLETLSLYTDLFIKLGLVALVGAVVSVAMIPMMKRLSARVDDERASQAEVEALPLAPQEAG